MPAPQANAMSFRRLTGMPISSAASGSSRSDFHARPVRDWSTRYTAREHDQEGDERDVVVGLERARCGCPNAWKLSMFGMPFGPFVTLYFLVKPSTDIASPFW